MNEPLQTVNIGPPTWEMCARIYLAVLDNACPQCGDADPQVVRNVKEDLIDMGIKLDRAGEANQLFDKTALEVIKRVDGLLEEWDDDGEISGKDIRKFKSALEAARTGARAIIHHGGVVTDQEAMDLEGKEVRHDG